MKEAPETMDGMSSSELDAKLEHSYNQSIAEEGKPMDEVFDALENGCSDKLQAVLAEYDDMKNNPGSYKRYESFDALLDDVFEDKPLNQSIDNESLNAISKRLIAKNKEAYDELAK